MYQHSNSTMPPEGFRRCYKRTPTLLLAGLLLLAAGLLLIFLCIPGWAWAALAGALMILSGYALVRLALR